MNTRIGGVEISNAANIKGPPGCQEAESNSNCYVRSGLANSARSRLLSVPDDCW